MIDRRRCTVLVVEDDASVRRALVRGLALHDMDVIESPAAEDALVKVARSAPDLLVVDVGLPAMSGIELCATLREREVDTPLLILSARDAVGDRVSGLHAGADDYLVKPFDLGELVARLQALLRRSRQPPAAMTSVVTAGPLWLDLDRRRALCDGTRLDLSRREFDLLAALVGNTGIVLSRLRLLELVWGYDFDVDTNVVDVFVSYLRRKLQACGAPPLIHTVRGLGFVLRPDPAREPVR